MSIEHAALLIRAGRLIAFPTETVYGLGANALDEAAVERIFQSKGRPRTSPLIVHVDSIEMAKSLASHWPDAAETLARRYWPGPLTLVVRKWPRSGADDRFLSSAIAELSNPGRPQETMACPTWHIPDIVTAGLQTVGLRMPAHPLALELIRVAGVPIAAPSANRFMRLSPTAAAHIDEALADYVLDGGPAKVGIESTVLSLVADPTLLRPGVIPLPEIEALIGPVRLATDPAEGPHQSPGQHPKHYSPRTRLYLLAPGAPVPEGRGAWLRLGHEMPADPRRYAAALYDALHRADTGGYDWIAVEQPPDTPEWAGVLDRLRRAAH